MQTQNDGRSKKLCIAAGGRPGQHPVFLASGELASFSEMSQGRRRVATMDRLWMPLLAHKFGDVVPPAAPLLPFSPARCFHECTCSHPLLHLQRHLASFREQIRYAMEPSICFSARIKVESLAPIDLANDSSAPQISSLLSPGYVASGCVHQCETRPAHDIPTTG
jgi:hypothetical protein